MSSSNTVNPQISRFMNRSDSGMLRVPPEPRSRLGLNFSSMLSSVGSLVGATLGGASGGIQPQYMALINKQIEMQEQMQLVSSLSNIEKSRHESQMAAIRNIRTG